MRNLYLRIFLAFSTAMVLALTFTVMATLWLDYQRLQREQDHQDELARQASVVLASQGIPGLRTWLQKEELEVPPDRLYVLDRHGDDLLGRRVPDFLQASLGRRPFPERTAGGRGRDVRLLSQLVTPTEETYALSLVRQRPGPFGIFGTPETPLVASFATLVVSTVVCFLLARYLSDPIGHLRAATRSIADGDLSVRVASLLGRRRDELALLAVDFDAMAERLRGLLDSQQQLLRDVSHELRSPLARLQIALGLARRPGANLEQEFDRIEQETQRLDELIGEILSLSRLDDPSRELVAESVDLEELLDTVAENARLEAEPHWVRVDLKVTPGLAVDGDRELLYRAIENIVRNALRFSPNGASIEISGVRGGQQVVISVTDHGPGVPAELLERIFEPFFRVAKARDRDSGGHGIGLAITARVVSLHGGSVRASNIAGGGLRIEIRIPLRQVRPPRLAAPAAAVAA
jgi:two-component system sensor histidine kinase CpxA